MDFAHPQYDWTQHIQVSQCVFPWTWPWQIENFDWLPPRTGLAGFGPWRPGNAFRPDLGVRSGQRLDLYVHTVDGQNPFRTT